MIVDLIIFRQERESQPNLNYPSLVDVEVDEISYFECDLVQVIAEELLLGQRFLFMPTNAGIADSLNAAVGGFDSSSAHDA